MIANITICVGTIGSGAWTSPDGGDSWRRVERGLSGESRVYGLADASDASRAPSLPAPMTASTAATTAGRASSISTRR